MAINKLFTDDIKEITIRDERGIVAKLFSEPNEEGNLIEMRAGTCANLEYKNPSTVTVIHSLEKRDNKPFDLTDTRKMGMSMDMKIGYVLKTTDGLKFREADYTRVINSHGDKIHSEMLLFPVDYEEVKYNTELMRDVPDFVLLREPFILDDELKQRAIRYVERHNYSGR